MKSVEVTSCKVAVYSGGKLEWALPLREIAVIGEYTTEDGPGAEDYFISFVDSSGCRYDIGGEYLPNGMISQLALELRAPLSQKLLLETTFQSRVMYPRSIVDEPLFATSVRPISLFSRIGQFFGFATHSLMLSDVVVAAIKDCQSKKLN